MRSAFSNTSEDWQQLPVATLVEGGLDNAGNFYFLKTKPRKSHAFHSGALYRRQTDRNMKLHVLFDHLLCKNRDA
jgi:hypothetical protein